LSFLRHQNAILLVAFAFRFIHSYIRFLVNRAINIILDLLI